MRTSTSERNIGISLVLVSSLLISASAFAQTGSYVGGYKQIKRLGTNQAICKPAIHTADELQSVALNQRQDILDILQNASWPGDPQAVFSAIEAGEFTEKSYPVGSKFEWMGQRKRGKVIASPKTQWAGKQSFDGFELDVVSNCVQHKLVIPKACCNISLAQSTPIGTDSPVIEVDKDGQNVTIRVNSGRATSITELTHPDGNVETLNLTDGSWTGTLPPGDYAVEARTVSDCGESDPAKFTFSVGEPVAAVVPMAAKHGGWFLAPFIGRQVRAIDPPLVGLQIGHLFPIAERTSFLVQGGGSYNLKDSELSIFADVGIEQQVGENGFLGAGVGYWDINNDDDITHSDSPKRDVTYFIHGGANTPWSIKERPVQWFGEARIFDDFTDDISNHNILKLGLRIMQ